MGKPIPGPMEKIRSRCISNGKHSFFERLRNLLLSESVFTPKMLPHKSDAFRATTGRVFIVVRAELDIY